MDIAFIVEVEDKRRSLEGISNRGLETIVCNTDWTNCEYKGLYDRYRILSFYFLLRKPSSTATAALTPFRGKKVRKRLGCDL